MTALFFDVGDGDWYNWDMLRITRIAPRDHIFHILTRGNNRQDVFGDGIDHQRYLEILNRYREKYQFKLYHYVLIKNHVHLVLETQAEGGSLAEIINGINLSYAQHYKKKYDHVGHLWQDSFKSTLISRNEYLLACGSYVELNSARAAIVKDAREYRWSSYRAYAYRKKDLWVDAHPIYWELYKREPNRRRKYREFVKGILRSRDAMRGEMEGRVIYGSEGFAGKLKGGYEMAEMIKPIGRPKKEPK